MKKIVGAFIIFISFFLGTSSIDAETGYQLIIINKATNQLAFYEDGKLISTFKVATGRSNDLTPEGTFKIVTKIKNRPYYKDKIPGGDPANPLGDRWLGLDALGTYGTTYAIHGNNNPNSIGTYASAGCVRMFDEEVQWLFEQVDLYATVVITSSTKSFEAIAASGNYVPYSKLGGVMVDKKSPQFENTNIAVSAKTVNSPPSLYRFLVFDGTEWTTVQEYSTAKQFNWQPKIEGSYRLKVQVKSTSSEKEFDDEKEISYDIIVPATIESVEGNTESPLPINTNVTFSTVTNSDVNNLVKYSVFDGSDWVVVQEYSEQSSLSWKPTNSGEYKIKVQTKHTLSLNESDTEEELSYTIFEPATLTTVAVDSESPQPIDTAISFTAGSGNEESTTLFKFLVFDGVDWSTIGEYSSASSLTWKTAVSGEYKLKVQAKHELSKEEFDAESEIKFVIFERGMLNEVTTNRKGFQQVDSEISLKVAATSDMLYQFSIFDGVEWNQLQPYSSNNEFDWTPTKSGFYKLKVEIKHKLSNEEYDDVQEFPYVIFKSVPNEGVLPGAVRLVRNGTLKVKGLKGRRG
ncbi:triple tyrosine motif-containing protein [Bacillus sp. DJP31]|uniref:triple tyrosine motif-containing protein n=1 Tax=Bacillus sp. DJP31 TaxID=3409789 RepID=UPI003BB6B3C7